MSTRTAPRLFPAFAPQHALIPVETRRRAEPPRRPLAPGQVYTDWASI